MDPFAAIILGCVVAGIAWVVLVGWLSRGRPIDELIDKHRNERWAAQLDVDDHDLPQMINAANDYRRKRGLPDVTLAQLHEQVGTDLREQIVEQASKQRHAQQTHANRTREQRGF
jgi:hypothetical protein